MSDIANLQKDAQAARAAIRQAEETLYTRQNRLRNKESGLAQAQRLGQAGSATVQRLEGEIRTLATQIAQDVQARNTARDNLNGILTGFAPLDRPWELVGQLNDKLPFLLFPLRIEARFMRVGQGKQLWVRIFPDDIAVHTHEKTLTADEVNAGKTYWRERWAAERETDPNKKENIKKGAWHALAEAYGGTRAAWIRTQTEPKTLNVDSADKLNFPVIDPETLKQESWNQAPRTDIMPERFVVMGYAGGKEIFRVAGKVIPSPLMLGPDPLEDAFRQENGDLLVGESIAWIYDFDKAVDAGMGVKIDLDEPYASQGFERLLVLGLRLSSSEQDNRALLEELVDNHHYSPDGMSLLPQGTPTNNTDSKGSGFSSVDPGAEISYAVETGEVPLQPAPDLFDKSDGQRLAAALAPFRIPPTHPFCRWVRCRGGHGHEQGPLAGHAGLLPGGVAGA
jgi:hypothetical protein